MLHQSTTLITYDLYEATYYLMYGAEVESVEVKKIPENMWDKKGRRIQYRIELKDVPNWSINAWRSDVVFGPISEYARTRRKLKRVINRLVLTKIMK